jgi:hypothetical protein
MAATLRAKLCAPSGAHTNFDPNPIVVFQKSINKFRKTIWLFPKVTMHFQDTFRKFLATPESRDSARHIIMFLINAAKVRGSHAVDRQRNPARITLVFPKFK